MTKITIAPHWIETRGQHESNAQYMDRCRKYMNFSSRSDYHLVMKHYVEAKENGENVTMDQIISELEKKGIRGHSNMKRCEVYLLSDILSRKKTFVDIAED